MSLTTRQKEIYEKTRFIDSEWEEQSFAVVWNNIFRLNKLISISNGKLILEFDNSNHAVIKFERNGQTLLSEKISLTELIQLNVKNDETKQAAQAIKNLAEKIITS